MNKREKELKQILDTGHIPAWLQLSLRNEIMEWEYRNRNRRKA